MKHILIFCISTLIAALSLVACDDDNERNSSLPDYWRKEIKNKLKDVDAAVSEFNGDCTSFVFFTDAHWGMNAQNSPHVVSEIMDYCPTNFVLFGGDWLTDVDTNKVAMLDLCAQLQTSFAFLDDRLLSVYGNHDANGNQQKKKDAIFSKDEVYNYLQSNLNLAEVKYGDYFYYYQDDTLQNTRYICLDDGEYKMSAAQYRFLIDALNTLPADWYVVVSIHILKRGVSGQSGTYYHPPYVVTMTNILDAFQTRSAGMAWVDNELLTYNFLSSTGRVLCCVGGHVHNDNITQSDAGIPCIVFDSDAIGCSASSYPRQRGDVSEQCITYVVADHNSSKISCIRFGRGNNFSFEQ